jgi:hypothetical protein
MARSAAAMAEMGKSGLSSEAWLGRKVEYPPKRRVGRPPKDPEKGRRQNYTFRLSDQTRDQLVEIATENGRSLSEEIEWRIEESFREKQAELLAKSLLNGSDNLYMLMSRISGLVSAIENYKDKTGNKLGSKDWDNHEPTRAAIRAGIAALIEDIVPPGRTFEIDDVNIQQKNIFDKISRDSNVNEEDKAKLEEYHELVNIHHMELLGKIFAGILGGSVSLKELQSAVLPQM